MKKILIALLLFAAYDSSSCIIPFTRAGNLILIKAKVDSIEGDFILDTGAPKLILNITYFRNFKPADDRSGKDESGGITGILEDEGSVNIPEFSIGPFRYYQVYADRISLGHIEDSKGVKILGLLGMQLFDRFEMIIDYEKNLIYLNRINKKERSSDSREMLNDTASYNTFPISLLCDRIMMHVKVAGKKLAFVIDTGAETNVLDSRLSEKVFENVTINRKATLVGTGNNKIEALYGVIRNVKMGNQDIGDLSILITNLEKMSKTYEEHIDGMLGFEFLSLHKIGFNFVTRKMYIWK